MTQQAGYVVGRRASTVVAVLALAAGAIAAGTASAQAGATVTVSPNSGLSPTQSTTVAVSGSGFSAVEPGIYLAFGKADATSQTDLQAFKWVHTTGSPSASQDHMNPDGTFSTTLTISATFGSVDCTTTSCAVMSWLAHTNPNPSTNYTSTPITFASTTPTTGAPTTTTTTPAAGTSAQAVNTTVTGGGLSLTLAGTTVSLSPVTLNGTNRHSGGALNPATVTDARDTGSGWSLTGQVTPFAGPANDTIPADNLLWQPTTPTAAGGSPGMATAGGVGTLGSPRSLCTGANGNSRGQFTCGAGMDLTVPAFARAGTYSATLTLTLV